MSRRLRRTKIVTTLGPATDRDNNLEKLFQLALTLFVSISLMAALKII